MPKHIPGNTWPKETKLEAVKSYLVLGSAPLVSAVTGVSADVIRQWRMTQWWKDFEAELKRDDEIKLSTRLKKVMAHSISAVEDRLEHGDFILNQKTGALERRPVMLKDAHRVTIDLIDKTRVIDGQATSRTETVQGAVDQLKLLAEEFAKFASGKRQPEVIDVEDVEIIPDAIHEGETIPSREDRVQSSIL
jgi:hypothetical protein